MNDKFHHDHDEELADHYYGPLPKTRDVAPLPKALLDRPRLRSRSYWKVTGRLVMEYFELQAGVDDSGTLREGFIGWLKRSPGERRQYEEGDDMKRAALVDWFLTVVR